MVSTPSIRRVRGGRRVGCPVLSDVVGCIASSTVEGMTRVRTLPHVRCSDHVREQGGHAVA